MNITIRKSPAAAGQLLVDFLVDGGKVPQTWEGYQVITAQDVPELIQEWTEGCSGLWKNPEWCYPLVGRSGWADLYKRFGRWFKADPDSVHEGSVLPDGGFAALDCGEFAVILQQDVTDRSWWDWEWIPVYVLGSAD